MIIYKNTLWFRFYACMHRFNNGKDAIVPEKISLCKFFWYPTLIAITSPIIYIILGTIWTVNFIFGYFIYFDERRDRKYKSPIYPWQVILATSIIWVLYYNRELIIKVGILIKNNALFIIEVIAGSIGAILVTWALYKLYKLITTSNIVAIIHRKLCPIIEFKDRLKDA